MKNTVKISIISAVAAGCIALVIICHMDIGGYQNEIPVSLLHASYAIDVNNMKAVVGFSDYVFVADVKALEKTEYNGALPYSVYTLRVRENIKGELVTDKDISVRKAGGISSDGKAYFVYDDDILPEIGGRYIFIASGQPEGVLIVCGANSTFSVDMSLTDDDLQEDNNYKKVKDAVKKEIVYDRKRDKSIYDLNY